MSKMKIPGPREGRVFFFVADKCSPGYPQGTESEERIRTLPNILPLPQCRGGSDPPQAIKSSNGTEELLISY